MSPSRTGGRLEVAGAGLVVFVAGCMSEPPPPPPTRAPVAFAQVEVSAVGDIARGGESTELILRLTEAANAGFGRGTGSLQVTLTDHAGFPETLRFTGTPTIDAPGSLGASVALNGRNVLTVNIEDSDPLNVEPMIISGLTIAPSPTAALGSVNMVIGGCAGSLAGCVATNVLRSPGDVVEPP